MAGNAKPKNKKLYYRRVIWAGIEDPKPLEDLLVQAHNNSLLSTVGSRTFAIGNDTEIKGADHQSDENGLFLQITKSVPGQPTSTIDRSPEKNKSAVDAFDAPDGKDYLEGEIFVLVKGNDVILCPSGARESAVDTYFTKVLEKMDLDHYAVQLRLTKVANADRIKLIQSVGVKEIRLNSSLYQASMMQMDSESVKVESTLAAVASQVKRIFAQDPSLRDIGALENLDVNLSIRYDGKTGCLKSSKSNPDFGVSGKKRLNDTAINLITEVDKNDYDGDGFTIVANNDVEIKSTEMRVSDSKKIASLGRSISKVDAWDKLRIYYTELKGSGVLSQ
ncbi:Uncharacterised protein [BD1-7 clade bacterium]|uniref:Uncharacterized protein n=1 Tax=BD1-7 clade bacterium TaxID=2029982 RepID=A0A5S9Q2A6_9GAMM|nr:Uncharacterised protein [BD1-7 clade bacterium]CAA0111693.1 Uncharacterised protein [BD1-7 clade bacterium]